MIIRKMERTMTIRENNPTIFEQLQVLLPDCKIFLVADGVDLDELYIFKYGNRQTLDDLDSNKTAKYCKMLYADKWDSAYDLITTAQGLMLDMGNMKSTVTTKEYGYTDTVTDTEKIPAFDLPNAELDRQTDRSLTHIDNVNKTTVLSDDKNIDSFNRAVNVLKVDLIDNVVFADVNRLITYRLHNTNY